MASSDATQIWPFLSTSPAAFDRVKGGGVVAIDAFLRPRVNALKKIFDKTGDPELVRTLAEGFCIGLSADSASAGSFQYARLLDLCGEMLLFQGMNAECLRRAKNYVETAICAATRVENINNEVIGALINFVLHHVVILKALGRTVDAMRDLRKLRTLLTVNLGASRWDVIMLDRQEVLFLQEARAFANMVREGQSYAAVKPAEYYGTIRRAFEFAVNNDRIDDARELLPILKSSYRAASAKLSESSRVSFVKNVAQYYLGTGLEVRAMSLLRRARQEAQALSYHGQLRQIDSLMQPAEGRSRRLPVFHVN